MGASRTLDCIAMCYRYDTDAAVRVMSESVKRDDAGTPPPCRRACIDNSLISVQSSDGDVVR